MAQSKEDDEEVSQLKRMRHRRQSEL
jgi:hypothetical protein